MAQPITTLISIVGCQYREDACRKMVADEDHWMDYMKLEFEPENEFDPNAIAVKYQNMLVGYVSKKTADNVRPHLQVGQQPTHWQIIDAKFTVDILQWAELEVTF